MNIQEQFYHYITENNLEKVKLLLQDEKLDPCYKNNFAIRYSTQNRNLDMIKLLIKDKRIDPSANKNISIKDAYYYKHNNIVQCLWQDERVRNSLENDYKELYNKLIIKDNVEKF